ncbi:hypothetical protein [uncultured Croceitalea sp.]|uniref:hypothetical protein n=1 Tax=uncultured Croceitalea sp. TaxID=1798908 RepID=UPI003306542A
MKSVFLFSALCILSFFIGEIGKYFLNINSLIYESLSYQFAHQYVDKVFENVRRWQLVGYLLIPLLLFIKTQAIAGVLGIGTFFFDKELSHRKLWNIALRAEFVFLIPQLLKLLWFYFYQVEYTLHDLETFYPLSLLNFFDVKELPLWYLYPLQTISFFELLYIGFMAFLLDKTLKEKRYVGVKIAFSSYLPALLIWVASIMFLVLNQT